jgi:hypothetical protein
VPTLVYTPGLALRQPHSFYNASLYQSGNIYVQRLSFGAQPPRVRGVRTIGRYSSVCARYTDLPPSRPQTEAETESMPSAEVRDEAGKGLKCNATESYDWNSDCEPDYVCKTGFGRSMTHLLTRSIHLWHTIKHSAYAKLGWVSSPSSVFEEEVETAIRMVPCERVVVDLDLSYLSNDLDVVISLRRGSAISSSTQTPSRYTSSPLSSAPEVSISVEEDMEDTDESEAGGDDSKKSRAYGKSSFTTSLSAAVSEVAMSGIVRIDAEVIKEYPFLGNATVRIISMDQYMFVVFIF